MAVEPKTVEVVIEPGSSPASAPGSAIPAVAPAPTPGAAPPAPAVEAAAEKKFGISVSHDLHASLQKLAAEEGVSVSEVCRRAISEALEDNPDRIRKRLARECVALAESLEAAEKAGHIRGVGKLAEQLRAISASVAEGKPAARGFFDW